MAPYNPQKHHRRSIRLKGYDYTQPGAYFITLVTYQRDELFGEIVDGEMKLSALGQIVHDEWMRSISLRKEIGLNEDEFIVMPNHLHGIVWIVDRDPAEQGTGAWHAPSSVSQSGASLAPLPPTVESYAGPGASLAPLPPAVESYAGPGASLAPLPPAVESHAGPGAGLAPLPPAPATPALYRAPRSLGSFIAGFKAAVTSRARRELDMESIWQRNYYEHIIRNEREFTNIWNYIDTNSLRWQADQLRSSAPPNRKKQG